MIVLAAAGRLPIRTPTSRWRQPAIDKIRSSLSVPTYRGDEASDGTKIHPEPRLNRPPLIGTIADKIARGSLDHDVCPVARVATCGAFGCPWQPQPANHP